MALRCQIATPGGAAPRLGTIARLPRASRPGEYGSGMTLRRISRAWPPHLSTGVACQSLGPSAPLVLRDVPQRPQAAWPCPLSSSTIASALREPAAAKRCSARAISALEMPHRRQSSRTATGYRWVRQPSQASDHGADDLRACNREEECFRVSRQEPLNGPAVVFPIRVLCGRLPEREHGIDVRRDCWAQLHAVEVPELSAQLHGQHRASPAERGIRRRASHLPGPISREVIPLPYWRPGEALRDANALPCQCSRPQ